MTHTGVFDDHVLSVANYIATKYPEGYEGFSDMADILLRYCQMKISKEQALEELNYFEMDCINANMSEKAR